MSSQASSFSSYTPATPPGLSAPRPRRPILTVRSFNDLPTSSSSTSMRKRFTPPATPHSLTSPSRSNFSSEHYHRRTLSTANPYRSPPPSPTLASPPPPVPPIPAFVLSPPATVKHGPQPAAIMPIHLPDLDSMPALGETTNTPRSRKQPPQHHPASEKTRTVAMTCLRFFSLRNSKRRTPASPSVA
ncbi:hypothetical protein DXG01_003081 [Tephrocybe rancida]|nr:hypothetical protein DXG01_003081 [Tephrocybe rancida]